MHNVLRERPPWRRPLGVDTPIRMPRPTGGTAWTWAVVSPGRSGARATGCRTGSPGRRRGRGGPGSGCRRSDRSPDARPGANGRAGYGMPRRPATVRFGPWPTAPSASRTALTPRSPVRGRPSSSGRHAGSPGPVVTHLARSPRPARATTRRAVIASRNQPAATSAWTADPKPAPPNRIRDITRQARQTAWPRMPVPRTTHRLPIS
jgi:hypothetical protein